MTGFRRNLLGLWAITSLSGWLGTTNAAITVNSTILVLARDSNATVPGTAVLQGYGIPFSVVDISKGAAIPVLNSTTSSGNYGGIVAISSRDYVKGDDWHTILTDKQWQQLYTYQESFGVRLVRLNAWPGAEFGTTAVSDSGTKADQQISVTDVSAFSSANLVV
jgi:hypothetical protein